MRMRKAAIFGRGSRLLVLCIPLVLGAWMIGWGTEWFQDSRPSSQLSVIDVASSADRAPAGDVASGWKSSEVEGEPAFPLEVAPGGRYLVDSADKPFLIHGDTAWSLIAQLSREEVKDYLNDRRRRGFNTILVSLIEHAFATNAPANAYGQEPFRVRGDFSTPNRAYFAHAHWVLRKAARKGFLVLLTPSYAGSGGSGQGWYREMVANGTERLRRYGRYLGRLYRDCPNILWVHGGDYNMPRKDLARALAEGIQETNPDALHTAHGSRNTAALDYWTDEHWLEVNNIYTARPESWSNDPVYASALEQYARNERAPFFLIEGVYENEHGADERQLRTQAYQAMLSGAAGQVFGNNPIWYFDGPGLYAVSMTWQEALDSRGAQSMTHLRELLADIPWWRLKPDMENDLLTDGLGPKEARAVATRAADRSLALIYLPSARKITVNLGELAGPMVAARWYDPAAGQFSAVGGSPFPATGLHRFEPAPASNSSGFDDWVMLLESRP